MVDVTGLWKNATDRGRWSVRAASFMAKVKATKAVWFPPAGAESAQKAASKATKTTKKTARKTTKKATGAAKKTASSTKS
jgi:hypothetical protein